MADAVVTGGRIITVGVVFRGNRWLDGIITCLIDSRRHDGVRRLAGTILRCRQYSQIHSVIFSTEWPSIWNPSQFVTLSSKIKLPVIIMVTKTTSTHHPKRVAGTKPPYMMATTSCRTSMDHESLFLFKTKLNLAEANEILSLTCSKGSAIPEALRVAQLIAERIADLKKTDQPK